MKIFLPILLTTLSFISWAAPVVDVFNVPPFTENNSEEIITKENIAHDTVVEMDPFTLALPKGWSFMAAGTSSKMTASLTATPSTDFDGDDTYVGLNERKEPPQLTLEERKQKYNKEKKSWKTYFDEWNNVRWLVVEYVDADPKNTDKKINHWSAFTISKGKEYWLLAATPDYKVKIMETPIHDIMKSVALRGIAPVGASKAVASQVPVASFDPRLQDHWKIVGFKMEEAPVLWTEKEAQEMVGKTVVFDERHMAIGSSSCRGTSKPVVDKQEEKTLLDDVENPCGTTAPGGPILVLTRKNCTKKISFPPYLTFGSEDDVVAFGDAISFCLKRDKAK
jgi:hypothetical protein